MARVYALNGVCRRFLRDEREYDEYGPLAGAEELEFDSLANAALIDDMRHDPSRYTLVSGVLSKDGTPVTINPPDADQKALRRIRKQTKSVTDQLQTIQDTFDSMTAAQQRAATKTLAGIVQDLTRAVFILTKKVGD